jgi:predicted Zn-dependent protease
MRILAVNETPVTDSTAAHVMQLITRAARAKIQPLELSVQDGSPRTLAFDGVAACRLHLKLVKDDIINASADGTTISVTTGMLTFVKTDAELAFVIAHEIAHNVLDHPDAARVQVLMNAFHAAVTGERRGSMARDEAKHREVDADYFGLYILAKAGYDVRSVGDLWRRIESLSRGQPIVNFAEIHPTTSERLVLLQRTADEIESRRREGMSLQPKGLESNLSIGSEAER